MIRVFPRLHKARAENERLLLLLAYQHGRMRDMASEALGMRVALAQMSPPVRRPAAVDATVVLDRVVA